MESGSATGQLYLYQPAAVVEAIAISTAPAARTPLLVCPCHLGIGRTNLVFILYRNIRCITVRTIELLAQPFDPATGLPVFFPSTERTSNNLDSNRDSVRANDGTIVQQSLMRARSLTHTYKRTRYYGYSAVRYCLLCRSHRYRRFFRYVMK